MTFATGPASAFAAPTARHLRSLATPSLCRRRPAIVPRRARAATRASAAAPASTSPTPDEPVDAIAARVSKLAAAQSSQPTKPKENAEDLEEAEPVSAAALQQDDGSLSPSIDPADMIALPRRMRRRAVPDQPSRLARMLSWWPSHFLPSTQVLDMLLSIAMFGCWYWSNTAFNVYNKQVLKVFPFPVTCTVVQFAVAAATMASLWVLRLKEKPRFSKFLLRATLPLAILHAAGFLLTNMSLGKVSVAFTHTIKSTEPFFSVALTPSILGDIPSWGIVFSLFPIVGGVALASLTEVSFNWTGFLSAIGSNVALQSRNVLSKKLMNTAAASPGSRASTEKQQSATSSSPIVTTITGDLSVQSVVPMPSLQSSRKLKQRDETVLTAEEVDTLDRLDNINLFSTMTILAFVLLIPLAVVWEGFPLAGALAAPAVTGMSYAILYRKLVLGGIYRCLDVLASYMILQRVSPVTHSVGNCVKRAVVIAFSIIFFKTKMSLLNIAGTLLALAGVFVYSLVMSACKQNTFGPDSPVCKPIYGTEDDLTEGGGI
jgi:Tpt phosphate/phosphoenolpyruvate translocator